jgi:hypothetical protein
MKTYIVHENFASVSKIGMISEECNELLKLKEHCMDVLRSRSHGLL